MFDCPTVIFDVETYPNYFLIGIRDFATGHVTQYSNTAIGSPLSAFRHWFAAHAAATLFIGFNSLAYDNIMLRAVLAGLDDPAALFALSGDHAKFWGLRGQGRLWAHRMRASRWRS